MAHRSSVTALVLVPITAIAAFGVACGVRPPDAGVQAGHSSLGRHVHLVLGGPAIQFNAVASPGYLAWSQKNPRTGAINGYVRHNGRVRRVNPRGTAGIIGGIYGSRVVYVQARGRRADIKFFDARTGHRWSPRGHVNTKVLELNPTVWGHWLLFTRLAFKGKYGNFRNDAEKVILFDLNSHRGQFMQRVYDGLIAISGQVNGDWVSWVECLSECNVRAFNTFSSHQMFVPAGRRPLVYGASIGSQGTLFYTNSRFKCGNDVSFDHAGYEEQHGHIMFRLPRGRDITGSYSYDDKRGYSHILFTRQSCSGRKSDVYEWTRAPKRPAPKPSPHPSPTRKPAPSPSSGRSSPSPAPSPSTCTLPVCTFAPEPAGVHPVSESRNMRILLKAARLR